MTLKSSALIAFAIALSLSLSASAQTFSVAAGGTTTPPDTLFTPPASPTVATGVGLDVDSLSLGRSASDVAFRLIYEFSVASGAAGLPATAVAVESASGDEAADIYSADPFLSPGANAQVLDGDGSSAPAMGLVEPPGSPIDDADAWDNRAVSFGATLFYTFSRASAPGVGFAPADILFGPAIPSYSVSFSGPYATALSLSLDMTGPAADSIDALIVFDDGDGTFGGAGPAGVDTVLFSLDPLSAAYTTIGSPYFGAGPGDILFADETGAAGVFVNGTTPATAVALGLAPGDDLNALDIQIVPEPSTLVLLGLALGAIFYRRIR